MSRLYYYINDENETVGPVTHTQLLKHLADSTILLTTKVSYKGASQWVNLSDLISEIKQAEGQQSHSQTKKANTIHYYYYSNDGKNISDPVTLQELFDRHKNGLLSEDALVSQKGDKAWRKFAEFLHLAPLVLSNCNSEIREYDLKAPTRTPVLRVNNERKDKTYEELSEELGVNMSDYSFSMGYFATVFYCFLHMFTYSARATRQEYWRFVIGAYFLIPLLTMLVVIALFAFQGNQLRIESLFILLKSFPVIALCYGIVVFFANLAVMVRRLHDTRSSGFLILLMFIPLVNLYVLILLLTDSSLQESNHGISQKYFNMKRSI